MKSLAAILLFTLLSVSLFSQAPALIPYQAIASDAAGQPLANTTINARFTIHDNSATGTSVWQETQTVNTNTLGCTNNIACNYNSSATQDDGTCYYIGGPCNDGNTNTFNDVYNTNCNCEGSTGTPGAAHSCGAANVHNPNLTYGSMTDQEGNTYKTIVIGTQEWMAENLNTRIYRNGDAIPTGLSNLQWQNTTQGAWAYYKNDASYACPYGKLFNWYACDDARGLCPTGWHVPSDGEWTVLTTFLGGESVAGGAMKSTGTIEAGTGLWYSPNTGATNSSGFSGLPGGYRGTNGDYYYMGGNGNWWSSTQGGSDFSWGRYLYYNYANVGRDYYSTQAGWGVRCLRD